MSALVCGSLAFDSIANFSGRFADQILPNQLHLLNVSFLVPTLRREFGGCAGNIAYNLAALGGEPVVVATVGIDGDDYLSRLRGEHIRSAAKKLPSPDHKASVPLS
jgi:adenosine kinase